MAGGFAVSGTVAPGASATKGLLAITAGNSVPFRLVMLDIFMDGGSSQFWPKLQLLRYTSGFTAPTGGTALTIAAQNAGGYVSGSNSSAKVGTFTAEVALGTATLYTLKNWYLPNQGGLSLAWPYQRELEVGGGNLLYLQAITPASFANNISFNAEFEE